MTTKATKRARARRCSLPGGQSVPIAVDRRGRPPKIAEDARKPALEARCRIAGVPINTDTIKAAVAPAFGRDVGLCIGAIITGEAATKAWDTFCHVEASYANYMKLYVGRTGNPQSSAIAMLPEPMETDPSLRVDLRTPEERVTAAKASWSAWEKRIEAIPVPNLRWAIYGTLRGFMGDATLWRDARPTNTGRQVVAALQALGRDGK